MNARMPVDVHGILERAGADAQAVEGTQAWALAQVDAVVTELLDALAYFDGMNEPSMPSTSSRLRRLRAAYSACRVAP